MNDKPEKIVTHEDLDAIAMIERKCGNLPIEGRASDILRRLRAAAEADAPPLPEGWVLSVDNTGTHRVYWHEGGNLYSAMQNSEGYGLPITTTEATALRDRLTPLRPTVTEAGWSE